MVSSNSLTILLTSLLIVLILPSLTAAQFQFFNNFFEGQHQQQPQEKQNVGSDSGWYQQVVENGMNTFEGSFSFYA
jgi:flagellar basal body-associated protein FliL